MSLRATTAASRHAAHAATEGAAATPTTGTAPPVPPSADAPRAAGRGSYRRWMFVALVALVVAVLGLTAFVHVRSISVSSRPGRKPPKTKGGRRTKDEVPQRVPAYAPPLAFDADSGGRAGSVRGGGGGSGGLDAFAAKDIAAASQGLDVSLAVAGPAAGGGFGGDQGVGQLLGEGEQVEPAAAVAKPPPQPTAEEGGGDAAGGQAGAPDPLGPSGLLTGLPAPTWAASVAAGAHAPAPLPWVRPGRAALDGLVSGSAPLGGVGRGAGVSVAGGAVTLAARLFGSAAAAARKRRGGGGGAAAAAAPLLSSLLPPVNLMYSGGPGPDLSRDSDVGEVIRHSLRSLASILSLGGSGGGEGGGDDDAATPASTLERFGIGSPLSGSAFVGASSGAPSMDGAPPRAQLGSFAEVSDLTKARMRRQRRCMPRQQRAETAWQAPGLAATVDGKSPYRPLHVFFAWIGMQHDGQLGRLRRVLCDVVEHTDADVTVHLLTDHAVARDPASFPITRVAPTCEGCHYRYYSWGQFMLAQESAGYRRLCEAFNAANQSPTKNSLATCIYLLKPFLHLILDPAVPAVLALDGDLRIAADLLDLLDEQLPVMRRKGSVVALAPEMQPEYELLGYGPAAWNGGVQLLDLETMRASEPYHRLLASFSWESYPAKWRLASELGDQTLYTVLAVRHDANLVHTLGCEWNRQLCSYYGDRVRECLPDVPRPTRLRWEKLFQCPRPTRILHGNCLSLRRGSNELEGTAAEWLPRQEERERRIVHESFLMLSGRLPQLFPRGTNGRGVGGPGSLERECRTVWLWSKEVPPVADGQRAAMQKYAGLRKAMVDKELAAALAV